MNVIQAVGLCWSNFVVTQIPLNEMTYGLKQGLEINIITESFGYQIWSSDTTNWYKACTQKYRHDYEYVVNL